jgi:hypothetical protein
MNSVLERLNGQTMIPDLLRAAPQVRPVLDRYGLRGCGGPEGPVESLQFFARAHDVPLDKLLQDLRTAAAQSQAPRPEPPASDAMLADSIYRPFFKAGIVVVLTLGAAWGALLLLRIALSGAFGTATLHEINAHGHAQIFGWVGLFVMGFAYQAFPRFKHTSLAWPRLAHASLWLMATGLVARSVLEPLIESAAWLIVPAVVASVLEVLAVGFFATVVLATWRRSGKPLAVYDGFILCAITWFVVQTVYDAVYFTATATAADRPQLLALVATWQGPLREIQIHGFALLMILGVSQRIFPYFFGLPAPRPRVALVALGLLNLALLGEVAGSLLMRLAGHAWTGLWYGSVLLLAGTVFWLVRDWHIFARAEHPDRSLKFLRAAYLWLFASLAMLVLLPAYQHGLLPLLAPTSEAARIGFSHAYYGAARHAITVGFVSLMIVGVAAKVVPTLNGRDVHALSKLWGPFLLINTGCLLRVTGQVLTDFTPMAFPVAGVSGVLEVLGLAWWGGHLWAVMAGRPSAEEVPPLEAGEAIRAEHRVGAVLDRYANLLETFVAFGFTPLRNPVSRRLLAPRVTIGRACGLLGVSESALLQALNDAAGLKPVRRLSLPVLMPETAEQGEIVRAR